MNKCGKSFMPECKYFTTGGCVSPFNCPYKFEHESVTTATSTPLNPNVIYTTETDKDAEIERSTKERDEWKRRAETAEAVISDLRTKLAKAEHDRKRYKAKIEKLRKEIKNES